MANSINVNNTELELTFASKMPSGHGHYKVTVSFLNFETMETKDFTASTSNMRAIDAASELDGDEKYLCLYETIENDIQDLIEEWVSPLV